MRSFQPVAYVIAAALVVNAWHGAANAVAPVSANGDASIRAAVAALNADLKVTSIKPSAIAGLKEVIVGTDVLYFSDDGKNLIQGTMFEASSKRNLTDDALSGVRLTAMKGVLAKDMIVFPAQGVRKYSVKIISDIDCGVCRKLHSEIAQFSAAGIEVQYLLMPRSGPTGDSARKTVAVYCAASPQKALTDAKNGTDPGNASCPNPVARNIALANMLGIHATPTVVYSDGGVMPGYLPAPALLAELDRRAALKLATPL
jgi:thiol:disulfide interchange protein DsbC